MEPASPPQELPLPDELEELDDDELDDELLDEEELDEEELDEDELDEELEDELLELEDELLELDDELAAGLKEHQAELLGAPGKFANEQVKLPVLMTLGANTPDLPMVVA